GAGTRAARRGGAPTGRARAARAGRRSPRSASSARRSAEAITSAASTRRSPTASSSMRDVPGRNIWRPRRDGRRDANRDGHNESFSSGHNASHLGKTMHTSTADAHPDPRSGNMDTTRYTQQFEPRTSMSLYIDSASHLHH